MFWKLYICRQASKLKAVEQLVPWNGCLHFILSRNTAALSGHGGCRYSLSLSWVPRPVR